MISQYTTCHVTSQRLSHTRLSRYCYHVYCLRRDTATAIKCFPTLLISMVRFPSETERTTSHLCIYDLCRNCLQGNTSHVIYGNCAWAHSPQLMCRGVECGACIYLPLNWCKTVNESCLLVGTSDRLIYSFFNYHLYEFVVRI